LEKHRPFLLEAKGTVAQGRRYYFSTRDLLMMAVLAALGGVASTYIQTLANAVHAALGFPGATQALAGLHVVWIVLAVGLTGKQGAGTVTGIAKGAVEFLSGNTHGILILLIDVVAGIMVDLGMLPFRNKNSHVAYAVAGGLATASNVWVFQAFASIPTDVLTMGAILLVSAVSFVSGILLAGVLGKVLLDSLRRAGVVRDQPAQSGNRWAYGAFLGIVSVLTLAGGLYIYFGLKGPPTVHVGGQVEAPYDYSFSEADEPLLVTVQETAKPGLMGTYTGVPLEEIVSRARPSDDANSVLVRGNDGYDFFIDIAEVEENEQLILAQSGGGEEMTYGVAGARNSKAWVRNVVALTVIGPAAIEFSGSLEKPRPYDPDLWQFEMDNARLDLGYGTRKYQGVSLVTVLEAMEPQPQATKLTLTNRAGEVREIGLLEVMDDSSIRIFTVAAEEGLTFAVASDGGKVWLTDVTEIEVS
jgi:ABC-type thiamin/hydroxymethylpyrimidine transport system permease subunit